VSAREVADLVDALGRLREAIEVDHGEEEAGPAVTPVALRSSRQVPERGGLQVRLLRRRGPVPVQHRPERSLTARRRPGRLPGDERGGLVAREVVKAGVEARVSHGQPCLKIAYRSRGHAAGEADQQTLAAVADRAHAAARAGLVVDEAVPLLLPPGAVETDLRRHDDALDGF